MAERSPLWAPSGASDLDELVTVRRPGFGIRMEVHASRWEALRGEIDEQCRVLGVAGLPEASVHLDQPQVLNTDRYDQALVVQSDVEHWASTVVTCMAIVANPTISLAYQARMVIEVAGLLARPGQREYALRGMTLSQPWLGGNDIEALTTQIALAILAAHSRLPDVAASMLRNVASSPGRSGGWQDFVARSRVVDDANIRSLCHLAVELCVDELEATPRGVDAPRTGATSEEARGTVPTSSRSRAASTSDSDEKLLQRYAESNDHDAFRALVDRHGDAVLSFIKKRLHDQGDADEIWRRVFLEAARDARHFSRRSSVRSWLLAIASHRVLDGLKSGLKRSRIEHHDETVDRRMEPTDPFALLSQSQVLGALDKALQQLSPEVVEAIRLRFQLGLSYAEMGEMLGVKPDTLQLRVARALPILRRALEAQGYGSDD